MLAETLVRCVHPDHLKNHQNDLVSEEDIACQTWDMPNGVCSDCCSNNKLYVTGINSNPYGSPAQKKCIGCPARGDG